MLFPACSKVFLQTFFKNRAQYSGTHTDSTVRIYFWVWHWNLLPRVNPPFLKTNQVPISKNFVLYKQIFGTDFFLRNCESPTPSCFTNEEIRAMFKNIHLCISLWAPFILFVLNEFKKRYVVSILLYIFYLRFH